MCVLGLPLEEVKDEPSKKAMSDNVIQNTLDAKEEVLGQRISRKDLVVDQTSGHHLEFLLLVCPSEVDLKEDT